MQKKNTETEARPAFQTYKASKNKRLTYAYPKDPFVKTENEISPDSEEMKTWITKLHYMDDYQVEKNNRSFKAPLYDEENEKQRFWKNIEKQALTSDEYENLIKEGKFVPYDQLSKPYHKSLDFLVEDDNGNFTESPLLLEVSRALEPESDRGREIADKIIETLNEDYQKLYQLIIQQKKDVEIADILNLNKSTVGRRKKSLVKKIQEKL